MTYSPRWRKPRGSVEAWVCWATRIVVVSCGGATPVQGPVLPVDWCYPSIGNADLNGDGFVDFLDLSIFRSLFLQAPGPSASNF